MHAADVLTRRFLPGLRSVVAATILAAVAAGCASGVHTLENTSHMSREQLAALCADLEMRARQDCEWNMRDQQSAVQDIQTWEVNCRARRDSARESFENVCLDSRLKERRE